MNHASGLDRYNYVLGTQTIGPGYGFTEETRLVETAQVILDMGSNVLKISMGSNYHQLYDLPESDAIGSPAFVK
jgi:hypothetical protein